MILVTGCAGFIGYHLSKKLLKKNIKVIGIDCLDNYYSKNLKLKRLRLLKKHDKFDFCKIDLKNFKKTYQFLKKKKFNQIIHLAAQPGVRVSLKNPYNTLSQNINGFINILEIARIKKVKKFIYASSSSVYGDSKIYPFNENDKENVPISIYGSSKFTNEILSSAYAKNFKLKCVGLRFFTVYGPLGRPDMAYYSFLDNLRKNKPITVFNKGIMKRDFTYIDDVIKGILDVTKKNTAKNHMVLNIGKGKPDNLMDLVNFLQTNYGKKFKIIFSKNIPAGDIKKTFSNTSKAKKLINWKPTVKLKDGIKRFVEWYKVDHGIK
ncbi:NAD-dependent epimerase/dehydratase family protein [Candidatus Pelagibacter bacterium nBUS_32]|uniref:NAD-dependent epimerase/dehydratase family protein n=1 Tax=Candidatus Pelagibacter bacterium nBUS_32 TaxID=3374192 RepID=UPI003EC11876